MLLKVNLKKVPILQALLRSAAEYFAYLVSLGCRNQALSGAHFFKISLCSIFAKNIANLVSLEICKQISARSLSLACALIGHYLGSLLQARHVFFPSAFTVRWSKKYILCTLDLNNDKLFSAASYNSFNWSKIGLVRSYCFLTELSF